MSAFTYCYNIFVSVFTFLIDTANSLFSGLGFTWTAVVMVGCVWIALIGFLRTIVTHADVRASEPVARPEGRLYPNSIQAPISGYLPSGRR